VREIDHPMVMAAIARMGASGAWERLLEGEPIRTGIDRVDVDLLVAAGVVAPAGADTFALVLEGPLFRNPAAVANWGQASLRRALRHATGGTFGWQGDDRELVLAQGRSSAAAADLIADVILPTVPAVEAVIEAGRGRFLDVGVGVAALSISLARRYPGLRAVGLDVLPAVLELAHEELAPTEVRDRIELRRQSVADLDDRDVYDLAWLPQPFIPRPAFVAGAGTIFRALRPGGTVVIPLAAPDAEADAFTQAEFIHAAHLLGGGPMTPADATEVLTGAGFAEPRHHHIDNQMVLAASKPA
jgi:SAM-dependent methyltransferase